jgi:hypothetical protein
MSQDRKNVITGYKHIVKDLLDNYDRYSDGEKKAIKKVLSDLYNLNRSLNKYDKKPKVWEDEAIRAHNEFFEY